MDSNPPYTFHPDLIALMANAPDRSIVSRTVLQDDALKVTLFAFAAGQELSEHTSAYPALIQILSGEGELTLGPDRMKVGPGAWVHMPPNLKHALLAHTPVVMLLTMLRGSQPA